MTELLAQEGNDALALRVAVRPGGCSGYSYEMFFDSEMAADDIIREFGTVKVVVDAASAELLDRFHPRVLRRSPGRRLPHLEPERLAHLRLRLVVQLTAATSPAPTPEPTLVEFTVDGRAVSVDVGGADGGITLLEALRDRLGKRTAKDGCSPQGQCGCCTVWVDGAARVACVTPLKRVAGRSVTTLDGLDPELEAPLGRGLHRDGGQPVRLLHPGDHHATGRPGREEGRGRAGGGGDGSAGPSVPLHGLVEHPRGGPPGLRSPKPTRDGRRGDGSGP